MGADAGSSAVRLTRHPDVAVVVSRQDRGRERHGHDGSRIPRAGGRRVVVRRRRHRPARSGPPNDDGGGSFVLARRRLQARPRHAGRDERRARPPSRHAGQRPRADLDASCRVVRGARGRPRQRINGRPGLGYGHRHGSRSGSRGRRRLRAVGDGRRGRRRLGGGLWCGRRLRRRRREGGTPRRKEGKWVDVGVSRADTDAEMDVRSAVLGLARRPGIGEDVALRDDVPTAHVQRAQMGERDLGVADADRHREAVRRNGAGEGHLSRDRHANRSGSLDRHVDPAMLAGGVGVPTDREATEHGTVGRPGPGERGRSRRERPDERDAEARRPPRCPSSEHELDGTARPRRRQRTVTLLLQRPAVELVA